MIIVPFENWHLNFINYRDYEKRQLELFGCFSECLEYYSTKSYSFTGIYDGTIIGVGGVYPLWKGVGEAYIFTSDFFDNKKYVISKYVKRVFTMIEQSIVDIHRVQASVRKDYEKAHRLAKFLGFKEEGTMLQYSSDKSDYVRYAKTYDRN